MSFNNLERKLELAIQAVIQRRFDAITVHIGFTTDDVTLPHATVFCLGSMEHPQLPRTGTMKVSVVIAVKSDADSTTDASGAPIGHYDRVGEVRDAVEDDTFIADLNTSGIEEFTAFGIENIQFRPQTIEGRAFVNELAIDVVCAGSYGLAA